MLVKHMTLYEKMIWVNSALIKGRVFTEIEKEKITHHFLNGISNEKTADRFYDSIRFPNNIDKSGRRMYPVFYIPPYNSGKKYKTVTGVTPKTHILSANAYELEILRVLALTAPQNEMVKHMLDETKVRLKTTCFGNEDDGVGECFDTSLVVLRFLGTAFPNELSWMQERIGVFNKHVKGKNRHSGIVFYYWLCLSEIPLVLALPEIERYKNDLVSGLSHSYAVNSDNDRTINTQCKHIERNCLSRLTT
jgi:hypothetical protein